jgi:anthranilate phosphoribosyltransferase
LDDGIRGDAAAKDGGEEAAPLNQLRLLVALDALLVEGSVGRAAERMGIGTPAMSRLLKQLRQRYDDPVLIKTGRGMVPTPLAESLRLRVRALAAEAQYLLAWTPASSADGEAAPARRPGAPLLEAPPLTLEPDPAIDLAPTAASRARRLGTIGPCARPHRRLARLIALTGSGGGSRTLTMDEAEEAMSVILAGEAEPVQVGALFVALQQRGLTAVELGGLALAARRHVGAIGIPGSGADLDWPVSLSPRSRFVPWFLLAAKLVARAGYRVLLHGSARGFEGPDRVATACTLLGIPVSRSIGDAQDILERFGITYLPHAALSDRFEAIFALYDLLEMRTPLSNAVHLLNPLGATSGIMGAVTISYQALHLDAAALLGWQDLVVLPHARGVAEARPNRPATLQRLVNGARRDLHLPAERAERLDLPSGMSAWDYVLAVWDRRALDLHPRQIVIDTAAAALLTVSPDREVDFTTLRRRAASLWN